VAGGVVGGGGDRQHPADRLDPEPVPVLVDGGDHLLGRRSSSAPKSAAADFRISLARRSSRFSRSSVFSRSRSRWSDRTAGRHRLDPPHPVAQRLMRDPELGRDRAARRPLRGCSSWCSNTIRTARSPSSCGYLPCLVMAPTSHESEPPRTPRQFNSLTFPLTCRPTAPHPWPPSASPWGAAADGRDITTERRSPAQAADALGLGAQEPATPRKRGSCVRGGVKFALRTHTCWLVPASDVNRLADSSRFVSVMPPDPPLFR
jgi:hypothetical protein